jgi:hypothetical protein
MINFFIGFNFSQTYEILGDGQLILGLWVLPAYAKILGNLIPKEAIE